MITGEVLLAFCLSKEEYEFKELKAGHINDTYFVYKKNSDTEKGYIFQRVNTYVFKEPEKVMHNIDKISGHLKSKLDRDSIFEDYRQMLFFLKTKEGKNFYVDSSNNFWRAYIYVDRAFTYDNPKSTDILFKMGDKFGIFQEQLNDFDAKILYETIPNFHNTKVRIEKFKKVLAEDKFDRVKEASKEITFLLENADLASKLSDMVDKNLINLRVTHNDTKCNNILFDKETLEAVAIIDLDTIMPGLVAYDFGDAIRSAANIADEDEKDLSKIAIDLEKFEAFTKGFVPHIKNTHSEVELDSLALGAFTMAYEVSLRFLTDYFEGNVYFKTKYEKHNLDRARSQMALAMDMKNKLNEMNCIVKKYCK